MMCKRYLSEIVSTGFEVRFGAKVYHNVDAEL